MTSFSSFLQGLPSSFREQHLYVYISALPITGIRRAQPKSSKATLTFPGSYELKLSANVLGGKTIFLINVRWLVPASSSLPVYLGKFYNKSEKGFPLVRWPSNPESYFLYSKLLSIYSNPKWSAIT